MGFVVVRFVSQGLAVTCHGIGEIRAPLVNPPHEGVGISQRPIKRHGLVVVNQRVIVNFLQMQRLAEMEMRQGVPWFEFQDMPELFSRVRMPALEQEGAAQVVVSVVGFRPQGDDCAAASLNLPGLAELCIDLRQTDPCLDIGVIDLACLFEGVFGLLQPSRPKKRKCPVFPADELCAIIHSGESLDSINAVLIAVTPRKRIEFIIY